MALAAMAREPKAEDNLWGIYMVAWATAVTGGVGRPGRAMLKL
jgi:hypothetical protein